MVSAGQVVIDLTIAIRASYAGTDGEFRKDPSELVTARAAGEARMACQAEGTAGAKAQR